MSAADTYARSEGTGTLEEQVEVSALSRCWTLFREGLTFIFSHVGLLSMVVGYCILGGITFEHLESENERMIKRQMKEQREELGNRIWNITLHEKTLHQVNWTEKVIEEMRNFEKDIVKAMKVKGWDGYEDETRRKWTFPGSLFYSIVLISTIGYGDQTPKTQWGKLVTIIYSILGIPLFFLFLQHLGKTMSRTFRFLYWRVCCVMCTTRKKVRRRCRTSIRAPGMKVGPRHSIKFSGGRDSGSLGQQSPRIQRSVRGYYEDDFKEKVGSLSADDVISFTVSNYDTDHEYGEKDNSWLNSEFKRRTQTEAIEEKKEDREEEWKRGDESKNGTDDIEESKKPLQRSGSTRESRKSTKSNKSLTLPLDLARRKDSSSSSCDLSKVSTPTRNVGSATASSVNASRTTRTTGGEFFHEFEYEDWEEVDITRPVPLWICIVLMASVLFGGAFLFKKTQGWSIRDSIYFCFITLSTVGFGDFVPRTLHRNGTCKELGKPEQCSEATLMGLTDEQTELVNIAITSLYLIFGLSLFWMVFHLVQDEVKNKVKNIAIKLGIVKTEEDDYLD